MMCIHVQIENTDEEKEEEEQKPVEIKTFI